MTPRFRVAGIPVRVHLLFLVTAFATGASRLARPAALFIWMGVVFVSVLLHELGHALAYRRLGCRPSIELNGLGGLTTGSGAERLSHKQDAWVSFAGPGTGFLVGGLVFAAWRFTPLGQAGGLAGTLVMDLLWVNIGWGLINLLPILPLDGGHILQAGVLSHSRDETAGQRRVHLICIGTAVALLVAAIWVKSTWLGVMALILGLLNFSQLQQLRTRGRYLKSLADQARRNLPSFRAPRPTPEARKEAAASVDRMLSELKRSAPPGKKKKPEPPAEEPDVPMDSRLVGELLLDTGLASLAIRPLQQAFTAQPSPRTAHPLCVALLDAGRYSEVATLLEGPDALQVEAPTLELISRRASEAGQGPLATRARELLARRGAPATPEEDEPR